MTELDELISENNELKEQLQNLRTLSTKLASHYLDVLMDYELDDGISVLELVLLQDPDLANRFREIFK